MCFGRIQKDNALAKIGKKKVKVQQYCALTFSVVYFLKYLNKNMCFGGIIPSKSLTTGVAVNWKINFKKNFI